MKRVIAGTAGHIDHGKTALVKALTGVDADRLKEEKERGITIDIGFADLIVGETHIGIIDVPGHERFVRNMLAGVHGIDLLMLIVAADEGIMPQTREHFDICRLLEIKSGLIVMTKIDLADEELRQIVEADIVDFVRGSFLEGAPILPVSSRTGQGIAQLKAVLSDLAQKASTRDEKAVPRLPVDRVFTIKGFGTVVTGTLISGAIATGDEVELLPSDGKHARIRGLQVHGKVVTKARAGERTAINLQGLEVEDIARGQVVAPAGRFVPTSMISVSLHLLSSAPRKLRSRARLRLHIGTAEALARVVLMGQSELAPGGNSFAQLRLEAPVLAMPGDRFIVRSNSPSITIGGGRVIDSHPEKHRSRINATMLGGLEALAKADASERIALLIEMSGERGMTNTEMATRSGSSDLVISAAITALVEKRRAFLVQQHPVRLLAKRPFESLRHRTKEMIRDHHQKSPLEAGIGREELRGRVFAHIDPEIFRAVIAEAVSRGEIAAEKDLIRLATHRVALAANELAFRNHLADIYLRAALQPISLDETIVQTMQQFDIDKQRARVFAHMLMSSGELIQIADFVFHRAAIEKLKDSLRRFKAEHGPRFDVAAFKDISGVSRKYAIPLLEYLDRQRVTRRVGNEREIL